MTTRTGKRTSSYPQQLRLALKMPENGQKIDEDDDNEDDNGNDNENE